MIEAVKYKRFILVTDSNSMINNCNYQSFFSTDAFNEISESGGEYEMEIIKKNTDKSGLSGLHQNKAADSIHLVY